MHLHYFRTKILQSEVDYFTTPLTFAFLKPFYNCHLFFMYLFYDLSTNFFNDSENNGRELKHKQNSIFAIVNYKFGNLINKYLFDYLPLKRRKFKKRSVRR